MSKETPAVVPDRRRPHVLRNDHDNWSPELKTIKTARHEAMDDVASFDMWHRLRDLQGLSKKAAIKETVHTIKALLERPR